MKHRSASDAILASGLVLVLRLRFICSCFYQVSSYVHYPSLYPSTSPTPIDHRPRRLPPRAGRACRTFSRSTAGAPRPWPAGSAAARGRPRPSARRCALWGRCWVDVGYVDIVLPPHARTNQYDDARIHPHTFSSHDRGRTRTHLATSSCSTSAGPGRRSPAGCAGCGGRAPRRSAAGTPSSWLGVGFGVGRAPAGCLFWIRWCVDGWNWSVDGDGLNVGRSRTRGKRQTEQRARRLLAFGNSPRLGSCSAAAPPPAVGV